MLCLEAVLDDGVMADGCDSAYYLACGFLLQEGEGWRVSDAGRLHMVALRRADDSDSRDQGVGEGEGVLIAGMPNIRS